MKKKIVSVLLCATMVTGLAMGCGKMDRIPFVSVSWSSPTCKKQVMVKPKSE